VGTGNGEADEAWGGKRESKRLWISQRNDILLDLSDLALESGKGEGFTKNPDEPRFGTLPKMGGKRMINLSGQVRG